MEQEYLVGTELSVAYFLEALNNGPRPPHKELKQPRLCPHLWCAVCLAMDLQRTREPHAIFRFPTLAKQSLETLLLDLFRRNWREEIAADKRLSPELKLGIENSMQQLTSWYNTHHLLLGDSTACFLPHLHWLEDGDIDCKKTAQMLIQNQGLSPELRYPLSVLYGSDQCSALFTRLPQPLKLYWNSHRNLLQSHSDDTDKENTR